MAHQIPRQKGKVTDIKRPILDAECTMIALNIPNHAYHDHPSSITDIKDEFYFYKALAMAFISADRLANELAFECKGFELKIHEGSSLFIERIEYAANVPDCDRMRHDFSGIRLVLYISVDIPTPEVKDNNDGNADDAKNGPVRKKRKKQPKREFKQQDFDPSSLVLELLSRAKARNKRTNRNVERMRKSVNAFDEHHFWSNAKLNDITNYVSAYTMNPVTYDSGSCHLASPTNPYGLKPNLGFRGSFNDQTLDRLSRPDPVFTNVRNYVHQQNGCNYLVFPKPSHVFRVCTEGPASEVMSGIWPSSLHLNWKIDSNFRALLETFEPGLRDTDEKIEALYEEYCKYITTVDDSHGNLNYKILGDAMKAEIEDIQADMRNWTASKEKILKYSPDEVIQDLVNSVIGFRVPDPNSKAEATVREIPFDQLDPPDQNDVLEAATDMLRKEQTKRTIQDHASKSMSRFAAATRSEAKEKKVAAKMLAFERNWFESQRDNDIKNLCLPESKTQYLENTSIFASWVNSIMLMTKVTTNTATLCPLIFLMACCGMHNFFTWVGMHYNLCMRGDAMGGKSFTTTVFGWLFPSTANMQSYMTAKSFATADNNDLDGCTVILDDSSGLDRGPEATSISKTRLTTGEMAVSRLMVNAETNRMQRETTRSRVNINEIHHTNEANPFKDPAYKSRFNNILVAPSFTSDAEKAISFMASDCMSATDRTERDNLSQIWQMYQYRVHKVCKLMETGYLPKVDSSVASQTFMTIVLKGQKTGTLPESVIRAFERAKGLAEVLTIIHATVLIFDLPDAPARLVDHTDDIWLLLKPHLWVTQEIMMFAVTLGGEFDNKERLDLMKGVKDSFFGENFRDCIGVQKFRNTSPEMMRREHQQAVASTPNRRMSVQEQTYFDMDSHDEKKKDAPLESRVYMNCDPDFSRKKAAYYYIARVDNERDFKSYGISSREVFDRKREMSKVDPADVARNAIAHHVRTKTQKLRGASLPIATLITELRKLESCQIFDHVTTPGTPISVGPALDLSCFPFVMFAKSVFGDELSDDAHVPWSMKMYKSHLGKFFPANTNFICGSPDRNYSSYFQLVNINPPKTLFDAIDNGDAVALGDDQSEPTPMDTGDTHSQSTDTDDVSQGMDQMSISLQNARDSNDLFIINSTHLGENVTAVLRKMGIVVGHSQQLFTKITDNPDKLANINCRATINIKALEGVFKSIIATHNERTGDSVIDDDVLQMHVNKQLACQYRQLKKDACRRQRNRNQYYPRDLLGETPAEMRRKRYTTVRGLKEMCNDRESSVSLAETLSYG
jgi:hypothetical protein